MKSRHSTTLVAALGLLAFAAVAAAQAVDTKPFIGAWKGTLNIAGQELEIGLNFTLDEAKAIQGTFDSISQGAIGLKLGTIEVKDKTISFMISDPQVPEQAAFKGALDGTGKKLSGEFTQAGFTGTFAVDKQ